MLPPQQKLRVSLGQRNSRKQACGGKFSLNHNINSACYLVYVLMIVPLREALNRLFVVVSM